MYRGVKRYQYDNLGKQSKYLDCFAYGLMGIFVYGNPLLLPVTICNELYHLELQFRK